MKFKLVLKPGFKPFGPLGLVLESVMGQVKDNEANLFQNDPKIKYLWYISTSFFLIRATMAQISKVSKPATQVKWLPTWVSHHSRINPLHAILLGCLIIFDLTPKHFGLTKKLWFVQKKHKSTLSIFISCISGRGNLIGPVCLLTQAKLAHNLPQ